MYLNYTQGNYLLEILKRLSDNHTADITTRSIRLLDVERRKLHSKEKKERWTRSDRAYDMCLNRVSAIFKMGADSKQIADIRDSIKLITREKIHIVFFTNEPACWPSMKSVYEAATSDIDIETKLVYLPFTQKNLLDEKNFLKYYNEQGYDALNYNEFNIEEESPDIAIMLKPYSGVPDGYKPSDIVSYISRIIYIPYGMEANTDLIQYGFQFFLHYKAWKHCAYGDIVRTYGARYGYRNAENIVVWGHPKADYVASILKDNKQSIPDEWVNKIDGRITILYTPHHLIGENTDATGTFLMYGERLIEAMLSYDDLAFIFRPHSLLIGTLINSGIYTQQQIDSLKDKINNSDNIIWDDTEEYNNAFNASDAIITDGTTFCIEYLYTKKPIILTPRNMSNFYSYENMLNSYYIANNYEDISRFIELIRNGRDPLYDKRIDFYNKLFYLPEGVSVGDNIIANTKRDIDEEIRDFALSLLDNDDVVRDITDYPLFTILVLCYKNTNLLYDQLDTILEQDYPNIELIVSDDASDDFDVDIISDYIKLNKKDNITNYKVIKNEINIATVRHVSKAFEYVTGEYVVYTAADDRFNYTSVISDYEMLFRTNYDRDWIVARCSMTTPDYKKNLYIYPTEEDIPYFKSGDSRVIFSRWARRGMAIPCQIAYKKEVIDRMGGFDFDYKYSEDWPLHLKMLRNNIAPIFLDKITAIHSSGGVTNSNNRYGKDVRKDFYDDKYLLFKKEVNPYKYLLTGEDKRCLKQYKKEIMKRQYFFNIDLPETGLLKRLFMCIVRPIRGWWLFENFFMKNIYHRRMWKVLVASGISLIIASYFFIVSTVVSDNALSSSMFGIIGYVFVGIFVFLFLSGFAGFFLKKHFRAKYYLRKRLVN